MNTRYEAGARAIEARAYVLKNGVRYAPALLRGEPYITADARAELKKSIMGEIQLPEGTDTLNDWLQPCLVIDGTEYPLGEYTMTTVTDAVDETGGIYSSIEAYDGCYLAQRYRAETRLHFNAGATYTDVIQQLLIECGVDKMSVTPNTAALATAREDWEIGTPYIQIINDLLKEINYASLWFDANGFARLGRSALPSAENIRHSYLPGQYSVIQQARTSQLDVFSKYNVFMAMVDSADLEAPMLATAVNDNPTSMLSIQRRGRIQAPIERLNNIASQEELQDYVDGLRDASLMTVQTANITTALMPGHEILDVVALEDGIYQEVGWSMTLGVSGQMTHTLEREVFR